MGLPGSGGIGLWKRKEQDFGIIGFPGSGVIGLCKWEIEGVMGNGMLDCVRIFFVRKANGLFCGW